MKKSLFEYLTTPNPKKENGKKPFFKTPFEKYFIIAVLIGCIGWLTIDHLTRETLEEMSDRVTEERIENTFGEIKVINSPIGSDPDRTIGRVNVNRQLLTEQSLIDFHYNNIVNSGHAFFVFDFEDGYGMTFTGSRDVFIMGSFEDEEGRIAYPSIVGGQIWHHNNSITWNDQDGRVENGSIKLIR